MSNAAADHVQTTTVPHVVKEESVINRLLLLGNGSNWKGQPMSTVPEPQGVGIFALLKRTLHKDCVVLVKQFRPPMGCHTLEFPAGLIDENETAEAAALRELKEETGYVGEVVAVTPVTCLDPGISNCTTKLVVVNINGDDPQNIHPKQQLDEGEFVDVVLLPLNEFQTKIDALLKKEDIVVDSKVYTYAMGMTQALAKPTELPVLKQ